MGRKVGVAAGLSALIAGGAIAGRVLSSRSPAADDAVVRRLSRRRSPAQDAVALPVSWLTDVSRSVVVTAALSGVVHAATADPRRVALPGLAVAAASCVHVATSLVAGRPRPDVEQLGTVQVTSSFPSGHVGAATAQALAVAMLAADLPPRPRRLVRAACAVWAGVVGWSRLYTGQHYPSDVAAGYVNGAAGALLARHLLADDAVARRAASGVRTA